MTDLGFFTTPSLDWVGFLALACGWSGGAIMLGKLLVPRRPTNLDSSRARAYCACSGCVWGLCGHFSLVFFSLLFPSLEGGPM